MPGTRHLLITVDTEGDNLWSKPKVITTRNAAFLPRFQALCERYRLVPTWLVDYDMARDPFFIEFGRDAIARAAAEIGVHPHAWLTPPLYSPIDHQQGQMPYLTEYPESVLEAKLDALTGLLETTFGVKMVSHRAGRWSFNSVYAEALARRGFRVDCSVSPGVDWRSTLGRPDGQGGTDYSDFPTLPYPLITGTASRPTRRLTAALTLTRKLWNQVYPSARWFRPRPGNRQEMLGLMKDVIREGAPCIEFMLHSSELMPGGSPRFTDERSIEALYEDLEAVFEEARSAGCSGLTLQQYADHLDAMSGRPAG
jgi:hypothetical protein